jgi:ubiquinone/menaquinone biosynthesis C-methylase UbiE
LERFQLSASSAELYELEKVPAIYGPLAEKTLDLVDLGGRRHALDLGCGTGAVARALLARSGEDLEITGADLSETMLDVARRQAPGRPPRLQWVQADARDLPFDTGAFDIAFCQQALQFFADKAGSLRELRRVLAPGGALAMSVWSRIGETANAIGEAAERRLGANLHQRALAPFMLRDPVELHEMISHAGFRDVTFREIKMLRTLDPALEAMRNEIRASPYYDAVAAAGHGALEAIAEDACAALTPYLHAETLTVPQYTHLIEAKA